MLNGQSIVVDHLVKIIQALQIARTTGTLVATRGEEASHESGTLVFLNGRVVQARAGRREGREAFNWLSTWGKCRYTFVPSIMSKSTTGHLEEFSPIETRTGTSPVPTAPVRRDSSTGTSPVPTAPVRRDSSTGLTIRSADSPERATDSLSRGDLYQFMPQEAKGPQRKAEQVNEAVPHRSKPLQYSLQVLSKKSLSRTHRNVFLLIDGTRRVSDLMRLLKLDENEVLALLYDLRDTGVISLPIPLSV